MFSFGPRQQIKVVSLANGVVIALREERFGLDAAANCDSVGDDAELVLLDGSCTDSRRVLANSWLLLANWVCI